MGEGDKCPKAQVEVREQFCGVSSLIFMGALESEPRLSVLCSKLYSPMSHLLGCAVRFLSMKFVDDILFQHQKVR